MTPYLAPPVYAAFVWWFSTGAVLVLVGLSARFDILKVVGAASLLSAGLFALATTANDVSATGATIAFTGMILIWGAQEIAFLAGWLTGPRARSCPADARGLRRLSYALGAILYHELSLLACGVAVVVLTRSGDNQVGLWTFAALWVLRQSSKINLFLGVPVTNDELMPDAVRFLKTYFACKPVSAFFPVSVTLATAVLVLMIQRIAEVAVTPFEIVSLTLVSTMFALGVVEHWFMLLPLPALTLWGWGIRSQISPEDISMGPDHVAHELPPVTSVTPPSEPIAAPPHLVVVAGTSASPKAHTVCARQRLEDQFRQQFLEQNRRNELASAAISIAAEPAAMGNGRTS